MYKDLYHNIKVEPALLPVALTGTTNGVIIDRAGFESLTFVIQAGVATAGPDASNYLAVTMQEGDESDLSDASTVASANLLGSLPTLDDTGDDQDSYRVGYKGYKRYVRLVFTETGTFACPMAAEAILGNPLNAPVAAQTV